MRMLCVKQVIQNEKIEPKLLYPFTLLSRCGRRGGGPWPSLRNSSWEPRHFPWVNPDEAPLDIPSEDEWSKSRSAGYFSNEVETSRVKGPTRTGRASQRCQSESRMQDANISHQRRKMADIKGSQEHFSAFAKRMSNEFSIFSKQKEYLQRSSVLPVSPETQGRYNRWKGMVVPCWFPPCKRILFEDMTNEAPSLEMFYCKE